jgi:hypothetical protein
MTSMPSSRRCRKTSNDATISGERAAFKLLREELVKKYNKVHGKVFVYTIAQEENSNHAAFKKLLSDEQQAERRHTCNKACLGAADFSRIANALKVTMRWPCRLAGRPVPQRPTVSNKRAADGHDADKKAKSVNGNTLAIKKLRFDLSSTQTASSKLEPQPSKKRPAADDLRPATPASNFKRARVEVTEDQGEKPAAPRV